MAIVYVRRSDALWIGEALCTRCFCNRRARSQYTSEAVHRLIQQQEITILENHGLSSFDNRLTDSFFHTLKTEYMDFDHYDTREDGHPSLFDYNITVYYNRQYRHFSPGYFTPCEINQSINKTLNPLPEESRQYHNTPSQPTPQMLQTMNRSLTEATNQRSNRSLAEATGLASR